MKSTSKRKVVRPAGGRQRTKAAKPETRAQRSALKFRRQERNQRVQLRPLSLRALNALARLVNVGLATHRAAGQPVSRAMQEAVDALRSPRAGQDLRIEGPGARYGRLVVRLDRATGRVYLQSLEPAGRGMRPNTAQSWMIEPNEVEGVLLALYELTGRRGNVPPYCLVAHRGFDCRAGELVDPDQWERAVQKETASLIAEVQQSLQNAFPPREGAPGVPEGSAHAPAAAEGPADA